MTSSAIAPEPAVADAGSGDGVTHTVCDCTPDLALCGTDVTDQSWADGSAKTTCIVCLDLEVLDCPRCS